MSGNFVQRGDIAILDKYSRCEMALKNGADLVLELPVRFALSSAEGFASAAVKLLKSAGCNMLGFGAETDSAEKLCILAGFLSSEEFRIAVKTAEAKNLPFPAIREKIIKEKLGDELAELIKTPNNILAVEYIKAIIMLKADMEPVAVKRLGADHDDPGANNNIASASFVRMLINENKAFESYVPESCSEIIRSRMSEMSMPADIKNLERGILAFFRTASPAYLQHVPGISEGLENKLIEESQSSSSLAELCEKVKSKRYTLSRIRRLVLCAYLGITDAEKDSDSMSLEAYVEKYCPYLRLLGMNSEGREILSSKSNTLPIVTSYADAVKQGSSAVEAYRFEAACDAVYSLCLPKPGSGKEYYTHKLVALK